MSENRLTTYVLLVADTLSARKALAASLAPIGTVHAMEAASLADAFMVLQNARQHVDVVVVDLEMSAAGAVTLTRKIRDVRTLGPRKLAVLLIGGDADTPHYRSAARLGVQGHLPRPFTSEKLRGALRAALAARPVTAAASKPAAVRRDVKPAGKPAVPVPYASQEPVANKPFLHGLQALSRRRKPFTADDGFGLEPVVAVRPVHRLHDETETTPAGSLVVAVA
jgi:DNA-binding NarL/FixJ family response regulator